MKLYYSKGVCSLAVRIMLHEMNIACDYEAVDLKAKQTETGVDYLSINPKGAVPALLLDHQELLTETTAILQYLADTYHAPHLLPPVGNDKRYRVLEWLSFVNTDLHKNCSPLFWAKVAEETKQDVFLPKLITKLDFANQHLSSNKFLMGETITLPDGYLFVILLWLARLKLDIATWPNLSRYYADMRKIKSVQQALMEEGIS